jgi:hypothetical protein
VERGKENDTLVFLEVDRAATCCSGAGCRNDVEGESIRPVDRAPPYATGVWFLIGRWKRFWTTDRRMKAFIVIYTENFGVNGLP